MSFFKSLKSIFLNNDNQLKASVSETGTKNISHRSIDFQALNSIPKDESVINLLPAEILLLIHYKNRTLDNFTIPNYWAEDLKINVKDAFCKLFKYNLLTLGDYDIAMQNSTASELKKVLLKNNLKTTGKKDVLIKRLEEYLQVDQLRTDFPQIVLIVTNEGEKIIEEHEYLDYYRKILLIAYDLSDINKLFGIKLDNPNMSKYDIVLEYISRSAKNERKNKAWGTYRTHFYEKYCIYKDMNIIDKSLENILKVYIMDISGLGDSDSFSDMHIEENPYILKCITSCKRALNLTDENLLKSYLKAEAELKLPRQLFSGNEAFKKMNSLANFTNET